MLLFTPLRVLNFLTDYTTSTTELSEYVEKPMNDIPVEYLQLDDREMPKMDNIKSKFSEFETLTPIILEPEIEYHEVIELEPIEVIIEKAAVFGFDSFKPIDIDVVVQQLKNNEINHIHITGHTCKMGPAKYNWQLGFKRANALATYLYNKGIHPSKVSIETKGEEAIMFGTNSENRRASTIIFRSTND